MTDQDEFLLRMGFDSSAVDRGTAAMLSKQRAAAREYVGMWTKALEEQAAIETKANAASLARLKANMEAKAVVTKEFFAAQAAQYDIAQGSIPANMARRGESAAARDLESGAIGAAAGGAAGHAGRSVIMRELMAVGREGMRGEWTRMVGSLSRLSVSLGLTGATLLSGIPIIGSGIAAWLVMRKNIAKMDTAIKERGESEKSLSESNRKITGRLEKEIAGLEGAGMITGETAEGMRGMLAGGHSRLVQGLLRRIIPHGYDPKQVSMATEAGALDRDTKKAQDELKAMAEKERTSASIQKDIADTNERIRYEKASIAEYEKTGKLSQAQKLMLAREENDLAHDQVQLEKDIAQAKRDQADAQRATKEWQDWSNRAARDFMQGKIHAAMEEIRFPTIADMAGRNFTQRLGQQYGAGGRFDLGRGNGPLGDLARQYELAEKQQLYDRTYGNNAMAEKDRQNMISARARLVESGVQDPAVIIGKIGDDTGAMRKLFDALVQSGLIVKSN